MTKAFTMIPDNDARYGRKKSAWSDVTLCDGCGQTCRCVLTDSSEDEYGPVALCAGCFAQVLDEPAPIVAPQPSSLEKAATLAGATAAIKAAYSGQASEPRQPQPISFLHGPFADNYGSPAHEGEESLIRFVEVPGKKEQRP